MAPGGVLIAVRERFADLASSDLRGSLTSTYAFRNDFVAHEKEQLTTKLAEDGLKLWIAAIQRLNEVAGSEHAGHAE